MPFGLPIAPEVDDALAEVATALGGVRELVSIEPAFLEEFGAVVAREVATLSDAHRAALIGWIEEQTGRTATSDDISSEVLEAAAGGRGIEPAALAGSRQRVAEAATAAAIE